MRNICIQYGLSVILTALVNSEIEGYFYRLIPY